MAKRKNTSLQNQVLQGSSSDTGKSTKSTNRFSINGFILPDVLVPFMDSNNEFTTGIILACLATVYTIIIMLQLRLSTTAANNTVDGSASFKLYKRKIIASDIGRTLCSVISIFQCIPFLFVDAEKNSSDPPDTAKLNNLVRVYSDNPFPNHKKVLSPNQGNWPQFLIGELTSTLGIILSCPSSNIKKFNLSADSVRNIENPSQILSLIGLTSESLKQYGINESDTSSDVMGLIVNTINETNGGLYEPISQIEDPISMSSKLETKWIRIERITSAEQSPGSAKSSDFVKNTLPKLSDIEKAAYRSAIALGNKSLIANLEETLARKLARAAKGT